MTNDGILPFGARAVRNASSCIVADQLGDPVGPVLAFGPPPRGPTDEEVRARAPR